MRAVARIVACLLVAYWAAWIIGFVVVVSDAALLGDYLVWSWRGGGERAGYLQLFALISGACGGVFGGLWHLYRRNQARGSQ